MAGEITKLKIQKRNKDRVNVYLDGEYAFGLQAILAARLRKGQFLSDDQIEELREEDESQNAYDRALNYLSYRPRSRAEIRRYLQGKGVAEIVIDGVLERLAHIDLVDDDDFARYWVENREKFNPRGRMMLRYELRQKGVDDRTIDRAVEDLDEGDSAYRAAEDRLRRYADLEQREFRRKLGGYLERRGFRYDVIRQTVDRLWQEAREERPGEPSGFP